MVKNTLSYKYYIKDHLGNNRMVTDASGNVLQSNEYYPYGGLTGRSTNSGYQNFKYNGKEYDTMHGLNEYDYGARQYDPAIAQFTSMDPLSEKYYNISPYAYCGGNPINRVEPDGRDWYERDGQRIWCNIVDGTYTDKQGNEWTNIGHTYTDSKTGTYYSLFGQKYEKGNKDLKAVKNIDNAIINQAKYQADYAQNTNSEMPIAPKSNFGNAYGKSSFFKREEYLNYGGSDTKTRYAIIENQGASNNWGKGIVVFEKINVTGLNGQNYNGVGFRFQNDGGYDLVIGVFTPHKIAIRNRNFFYSLIKSYMK